MSYVGVDLDKFKLIFKVKSMNVACLLSGTKYLDCTHMIFPVTRMMAAEEKLSPRKRMLPNFLSPYEQKQLYKSIVGKEWEGTFGALIDTLQDILLGLPDDPINMFELEKEVGSNPLPADLAEIKQRPVYQPVSVPVIEGDKRSTPSAPSIPSAPPAPSDDAPWLRAAPPIPSAPTSIPSAPPSAPSIPKPPSIPSAPSAPKAGSTTGRVWAIADEMLADLSLPAADMKAFKALVVKKCEAQGINPGTAGTQFGAWKRAKGL